MQEEPVRALQQQAQQLIRTFNATMQSHRLLTQTQLDALARGTRVSMRSGTPERPVVELTLWREQNALAWSIAVDPTLPPRMREHAQALAQRFTVAAQSGPQKKNG